jgi:hypothetical protein
MLLLLLLLLLPAVGPGWRCESLMAYITDVDGLDLGMRPGRDWADGSYRPHIAQRACASGTLGMQEWSIVPVVSWPKPVQPVQPALGWSLSGWVRVLGG